MTTVRSCESLLGTTVDGAAAAIVVAVVGACEVFAGDAAGPAVAGAVWTGPGTDAAGNLKTPDGVTLTATADPIFSYLGAAAPAATYTVTNTQNAATLNLCVAASGRIRIPDPSIDPCP